MITGFRQRIPLTGDQILNRIIIYAGVLLVVGVVAFGTYYYFDRRPVETGPSPIDAAITRAEAAVRANPQDFDARMALASGLFGTERYAEAVEQYRAAVTIDDTHLGAIAGLARALYEVGSLDESAENFQKIAAAAQAADLSPQLIGAAYYFLARIALDKGNGQEAITYAETALRADGSDADALQMLGEAHVAAGNFDAAITPLIKATAFVPDFFEAYQQLELAYQGKGMTAEAQYARGMGLYSTQKYDAAREQLEAAIAANPDIAGAHLGLGLIYEKQGKKDAAIAALERAVQIEPNNFMALNSLSRLGKPAGGQDQGAADAHGSLGIPGGTGTADEEVHP
jgi:superkiller protein 3